ncbi:MAG: YihA family ribosome biogenesis GTP-binding protein [Bacteroidetes bacterium]|nr:YihA family ribosome biogenesis GTP-binding protein [Bacteroidota bacterium]HET6245575.1 ribosome biogenesis GTP-binding protein YihA/YsxC [Bacteroidia bacterium]
MHIKSAEFVLSSTELKSCPKPEFPEYAFIGRSNVGKSSLINMLTERIGLAKTSSKPGKTQLINHFLINESWYLTDLPGFGFAKVPKAIKSKWEKMIKDYLLLRENLMCVFVLLDSRLEQQKKDKELIDFLGEEQIPFVMIFTKTDKLSPPQLDKNIAAYKKTLKSQWDQLPDIFLSSAEKKTGRDEIMAFIENTNTYFQKPK